MPDPRELLGAIAAPAVQLCAFGFIDGNPLAVEPGRGTWTTKVQRPFRGCSLWLWGEVIPTRPDAAVLTHLELGGRQQLVEPMRFGHFVPRLVISDFLKLVQHEPPWQGEGVLQLQANWCRTELEQIGEQVLLPAIPVGAEIHFGFHGFVRGVVLVGVQHID